VLGQILSPWHALVKLFCRGVLSWAYVDDRSLKASNTDTSSADANLDAALVITERFDKELGLKENEKKRQMWREDAAVEHLGIKAAPAENLASPEPPPPRNGWDDIVRATRRLGFIPGPSRGREVLYAIAVASRYRWAAPFVQLPPKEVVDEAFKAIKRSGCTWWCQRRFWAQRISLHPRLGTAIQAFKAAHSMYTRSAGRDFTKKSAEKKSPLLAACLAHHAAELGLQVCPAFPEDLGIWLWPAREDKADERTLKLMSEVARENESGRKAFLASDDRGLHILRVIARASLLRESAAERKRHRKDEEGLSRVDIDASSHQVWKTWNRQLSHEERSTLMIVRGGAVWTPTRSHKRGSHEEPKCPWCRAAWPSFRHFWADCPHFDRHRRELEAKFPLAKGWWRNQPRVTAKSAWITLDAHDDPRARAVLQVASAELALRVCAAMEPLRAAVSANSKKYPPTTLVAAEHTSTAAPAP